MNTIDTIRARRAVKSYDLTYRMSGEEVTELLSLTLLSPTAFNIQHWRFVVVDEPELRQQIRQVAWNQAQVTDASLLVILCADLKAWEKNPDRYWQNAPAEVRAFMLPAIDQYYRGKEQIQRDEAMRSCGIAAQTLMLAAKSLGYDSCPMDGFDSAAVARLIRLPEDHVIAMFVAIGKRTQDAWPRPGQLSLDEVIINNRFGGL
ncbi:MAG: nitroreductase family protein [Nitrosomonadaceae bacterium]|nr:nitroreductase family protein [Nitrosomonadaceae bacterium]